MKTVFSGFFSTVFLAALLGLVPVPGFAQNQSGAGADASWVQTGDTYEEGRGRGLAIQSNPDGAKVFIDGLERGVTPLSLEDMRYGDYSVRIEKEGYRQRSFRISLRQGYFLDLTIELTEAKGHVLVNVRPDYSGYSSGELPFSPRLYVDGRESGDLNLDLAVGWREISVRAFGWETGSQRVYVEDESTQSVDIIMRPAAFRVVNTSLSRKRFNPSNSGSLGTTELSFEVTGPGRGAFLVVDQYGETVFAREVGPFVAWAQSVQWDGRDNAGQILPDGLYDVALSIESASGGPEERVALPVQIDSSHIIRPLTLSSGKSGLLYVPLPDYLPPQSFQVEGSLLFGNPPESGSAWTSLPFSVAFRLSPIESLEIAGSVDMLPVFNQKVFLGFAGSVKWTFFNPSTTRLFSGGGPGAGLALGLVGSWAQNRAVTPYGMGSGIELFLPASLEFNGLSLHLAPAFLWTGDNGFPWEPMPRLLLSGGLMSKSGVFAAGVSARSEFRYSLETSSFYSPSLMLGAELKFFPPPSNIVFTLIGGMWVKNSRASGFGGAGIGMLY